MQNNRHTLYILELDILELDSSVAKSTKIELFYTILFQKLKNLDCHGYMEISLKTGIEPRFSLRVFKRTVKLHVLLGKLRNFMEFSHGIPKYG